MNPWCPAGEPLTTDPVTFGLMITATATDGCAKCKIWKMAPLDGVERRWKPLSRAILAYCGQYNVAVTVRFPNAAIAGGRMISSLILSVIP